MISTVSESLTLLAARNEMFDGAKALAAIERVLGDEARPVALHEPRFAGNEWAYVKETLDSGWVSSAGKYVEQFETQLAAFCEIPHAVAVVNGTAALHIALLVAGVRSNDEVLIPALTFVATANAVAHCRAIPHFCDCSPLTLGIDPQALDRHLAERAELSGGECRNRQTGRRISAVIPMHTFGHPTDMDALAAVASRWNILVVEDVAEALGSRYKGRHLGRHGIAAAVSFNGNKIATTGGGGAILTSNSDVARAAKHISTTAKLTHRWAFLHDQIGFNYRLPNINAALGCAQLEQVPGFVAAKRRLAARYAEEFQDVPGASIFSDMEFAESNYWLVTMLLDRPDEGERDRFLAACHARGILCRPIWTGLYRLPMYESCPRMELPQAQHLEFQVINLPSSPRLGMK